MGAKVLMATDGEGVREGGEGGGGGGGEQLMMISYCTHTVLFCCVSRCMCTTGVSILVGTFVFGIIFLFWVEHWTGIRIRIRIRIRVRLACHFHLSPDMAVLSPLCGITSVSWCRPPDARLQRRVCICLL